MLGLLVALVLLALAVCAAAPHLAVVAAGTVTPGSSRRTDCIVAARSARDTARRGREHREGCAAGGSVTVVGPVAIVPDVRVLTAVPVVSAGI